ncbi:MAG: acetyl-CoA carboxylase biotin carboxyl carrier protein [Cyclobacteriaceae bacterium]|nr:acetyl-CoA carboxylase biotin carboxyl carrier protein [Cyclobacteriaceae bacterium]MCH8516321.1 acetyl-CoA carboxylase biotin carboxyl carrier protein [Cyclobacteriaceae bacterium]
MKAKEIQDLIDYIAKSGLDEVNIETEDFKIRVKKNAEYSAPAPVVASAPSSPAPTSAAAPASAPAPAAASTPAPSEDNLVAIKSPMIGTFYRAQNPESPAFAEVGDKVTVGQTVCIVEAMKLFNEIESDIAGTIVKVLVDNASPIEYDQSLFLVDTSK